MSSNLFCSVIHSTISGLCLCSNKLLEFQTPLVALLRAVDEGIKPWGCTSRSDLAERNDGAEGAPLQLAGALKVLLDGVLRDSRTLHALLERGRDVVESL